MRKLEGWKAVVSVPSQRKAWEVYPLEVYYPDDPTRLCRPKAGQSLVRINSCSNWNKIWKAHLKSGGALGRPQRIKAAAKILSPLIFSNVIRNFSPDFSDLWFVTYGRESRGRIFFLRWDFLMTLPLSLTDSFLFTVTAPSLDLAFQVPFITHTRPSLSPRSFL